MHLRFDIDLTPPNNSGLPQLSILASIVVNRWSRQTAECQANGLEASNSSDPHCKSLQSAS
jgi:hypothetical protein